MPDIIDICRAAWNATKEGHQPAYDDLVMEYRDLLIARAEAAITTNIPSAEAAFTSFERTVIDNVKIEEIPAEVKEELIEEVVEEQEPSSEPPKPVRQIRKKAAPKSVPQAVKKTPAKKAPAKKPAKSAQKGAKKR